MPAKYKKTHEKRFSEVKLTGAMRLKGKTVEL